jgi:hypothetical protein
MRRTLREISFTICPRHFSASCTVDAMLAKCGLFALSSIAPDLSCTHKLEAEGIHKHNCVTFTQRLSMDCAFSSFLAMASKKQRALAAAQTLKKEKKQKLARSASRQDTKSGQKQAQCGIAYIFSPLPATSTSNRDLHGGGGGGGGRCRTCSGHTACLSEEGGGGGGGEQGGWCWAWNRNGA